MASLLHRTTDERCSAEGCPCAPCGIRCRGRPKNPEWDNQRPVKQRILVAGTISTLQHCSLLLSMASMPWLGSCIYMRSLCSVPAERQSHDWAQVRPPLRLLRMMSVQRMCSSGMHCWGVQVYQFKQHSAYLTAVGSMHKTCSTSLPFSNAIFCCQAYMHEPRSRCTVQRLMPCV